MAILENNAVTCGKGWKRLYQPIVDAIVEHDLNTYETKNKIGIKNIGCQDGRMYVIPIHMNNMTSEVGNIIKANVKASVSTCELCGATEHVGITMNNQITTCCYKCWEKEILTKYKNSIFKEH